MDEQTTTAPDRPPRVEPTGRGTGPERAGRRLVPPGRAALPQVTGTLTRFAFGLVEGTSPRAVSSRDSAIRRMLQLSDLLAAALALLVAVQVLGSDTLQPAVFLLLPVVLLASRAMGLYGRDETVMAKTTVQEMPSLFNLATLYALALYIGQDAVLDGELGPGQGVGVWGAFFVCTVSCRSVIRRLGVAQTAPERCALVGEDSQFGRIEQKLDSTGALRAQIVARVPASSLADAGSSQLAGIVREHDVHRVIIATAQLDSDQLLDVVRDMKALGVKVSVKPRMLEVLGSAVEFEDIHGDVFLSVRRFGLTATERRAKRAMDVAVAASLLLLTLPLLVLVALAIKLGDRGPVLFRQVRIGRDGEPFGMWKFRSMVPDAEQRKDALRREVDDAGLFKLAGDPRVTPVGRLLRRTSLDELPQLLNVLRGEMALVGPRPLVAEEDQRIQGWHRRRLHLTPGMTGMWQVLGSARVPLLDMVALDYLYIVNWSLWRDVQILLRTAAFVVQRRGR